LGDNDDTGVLGEARQAFGCLGALILIGFIAAAIYWFGGPAKLWLSLQYKVSPSAVSIDAPPADCDFVHAPLGSKGCHYERRVTAYNADGDVVGGDHAPKYRHDTKTGELIISWDGGKTWDWWRGDPFASRFGFVDLKVSRVEVTWTKVPD
jgi:hypothetical protein